MILSLQWLVAFAPPGESFITCDSPITLSRPVDHPRWMGVGLLTPGAEKVIPLTRHAALLMWDQTSSREIRFGILERDRLRALNETIVRSAERFACGQAGRSFPVY